MISNVAMEKLPSPCVLVKAWQPKLGYLLPARHPVVVDATRVHAGSEVAFMQWMRMFVTLASPRCFPELYVVRGDEVFRYDRAEDIQ